MCVCEHVTIVFVSEQKVGKYLNHVVVHLTLSHSVLANIFRMYLWAIHSLALCFVMCFSHSFRFVSFSWHCIEIVCTTKSIRFARHSFVFSLSGARTTTHRKQAIAIPIFPESLTRKFYHDNDTDKRTRMKHWKHRERLISLIFIVSHCAVTIRFSLSHFCETRE